MATTAANAPAASPPAHRRHHRRPINSTPGLRPLSHERKQRARFREFRIAMGDRIYGATTAHGVSLEPLSQFSRESTLPPGN